MVMDSKNSMKHKGAESFVKHYERDVAALNEALMLGLVRQHELTEAAELLNAQLQTEIATRKNAEEALIRSEKLASVGRMAAVLAHEINNPLEAVTNLLFLAQVSEDIPKSVREYLETADGELKRIAHITRQTLGFYRESSSPITFPVKPLFDSVTDLLKSKVVSKQAEVETQCHAAISMTAFQGEMRQVLCNLLMNSLDAVPPGGKVTLRAAYATAHKESRPSLRITVADSGHGISHETSLQLFKPFFTTKGSVGNGLGLWISKQIVEKHGGTIRVRSHIRAPRHGTTFSMVFPVAM